MPGLSFLSPWFLAGAAALGLPILLHLFARQQAREVRFPATRFVPVATVEHTRRRRVTDVLLLLLRCIALALLVLAFSRPYFADVAAGPQAPATLVAIDVSFSMAAPDTWQAARRQALAAIDEAPAGSPVAVIAFDESGRVVSPPSADRGAARRTVEQLRPGAGATSFASAIPPAVDTLDGRAGTLIVVTDRQRGGLSGALRVPDSLTLKFAEVPAASANLAVADIARSGPDLEVTVANGGLTDRETEVSLSVDGAPVARQAVTVASGGAAVASFDGAARDRGVAVASIADPAGLPADDERTLVLDRPATIRVRSIVGNTTPESSGFFVRRALESSSRAQAVTVEELALPGAQWPDRAPADRPDVFVLATTRGLGPGLREQLAAAVESGAGLLVLAGPDIDAGALRSLFPRGPALRVEQAGRPSAPLALAPVDVRHAVFAPYADRSGAFSRVRFEQVVRIVPDAAARVLARFDNGLPALTEQVAGSGRVLLLATDLGAQWNDWPASPTFVPFVREAVGYLAAKSVDPQSYLVGEAPAAIEPTPGVHVLQDGRRVAVNVDPRESSLDLAEDEELAALVSVEPARAGLAAAQAGVSQESRQSLWRLLLIGMVVALVGESLISARRAARS